MSALHHSGDVHPGLLSLKRKVRHNGAPETILVQWQSLEYHFHVPEFCQPELQLGKDLLSNLIQWNPISLWKLLHFRKLQERIFVICLQQLGVFSQIILAYRKWHWMCVKGKSYVSSVDPLVLLSLYLMLPMQIESAPWTQTLTGMAHCWLVTGKTSAYTFQQMWLRLL